MTKIQLRYELSKPLDDTLLERIARIHAVYGIERVSVSPGMDSIPVEYDASRLTGADVEGVLHRNGIPVQLSV
jgi:hypothetical protein